MQLGGVGSSERTMRRHFARELGGVGLWVCSPGPWWPLAASLSSSAGALSSRPGHGGRGACSCGPPPIAGSVGHQRRFGLHASEAPAVGQTELMTVDNAGFHWMLDYR